MRVWFENWSDSSADRSRFPQRSSTTMITIFCVILCFGFLNGQNVCRTSKGSTGSCVPLEKCQPLQQLEQRPAKSEEDLLLLRQASCGLTYNFKPKVCCPPVSEWSSYSQPAPVRFPGARPVAQTPDRGDDVSDADREYAQSGNCPATLHAPDISSNCCGQEVLAGDRIVGGEIASVEQYPWLVLLEYSGGVTPCGGSLVSSRYVLTAAHCVGSTRYGEPLRVRLGEYNTTSYPTDTVEVNGGGFEILEVILITVERHVQHPEYRGKFNGGPHDIGLVKLTKNAPYTDFIRPICLPTSDITVNPSVHQRFIAAGWGSNGTDFSDVKQQITLPYVPLNVCQTAYKQRLIDSQLCAGGEEGRDSCKGDSGGPLMATVGVTFVLTGVVSFGHNYCGTKDVPGVYTNVYKYLDWIVSEMKK